MCINSIFITNGIVSKQYKNFTWWCQLLQGAAQSAQVRHNHLPLFAYAYQKARH